MIRTYHNFKQWVKRHYPGIVINPVYGTGAYTLDKPLSDVDMYLYNVQQLPSGLYIVFPGLSPEQVAEQYRNIVQNGVPTRPTTRIPTTFSSFETWLTKNQLKPLYRTHVTETSAADLLHDNNLEHVKRNWYMYEFDKDASATSIFKEPLDFAGPHVTTENGTLVLLVKTSASGYVSKRQLFLKKFATMQPIYDQIVVACAKDEWDNAQNLVEQYASIQFEKDMHLKDVEQLKEAYEDGTLALFTRNIANFEVETSDTTF